MLSVLSKRTAFYGHLNVMLLVITMIMGDINMIELAGKLSLSSTCQVVQPRLGSQEEIGLQEKGFVSKPS